MIFLGFLVFLFMLPFAVVVLVIIIATWWQGVTNVCALLRDIFTGRM